MKIRLCLFLSILLLCCIVITPLLPFISEKIFINVRYIDDVILALLFIIILLTPTIKTNSYINIFFLFFLASFVASFIANILNSNVYAFIAQFRNYFLPISCFYIAIHIQEHFTSKKYTKIIFGYLFLLLVLGVIEGLTKSHLYQTYNQWGYPEFVGNIFRVHTLFTHPGDYGYYLIVFLSLFMLIIQHDFIGKQQRTLCFIMIIMLVINILFTISMGPILSLLIGYIITMYFLRFKIRKKTIVVVSFISLFSIMIIGNVMMDRIQTRIDVSASSLQTQGKQATRVDFYLQSIPVISDNIIWGVGPGNFGGWVATKFDSFAHKKYNIDTYGLSSIDLFYPHIIGELGIIGSVLFFLIYVIVAHRNFKQYFIYKRYYDAKGMILSGLTVYFVIMLFVCSFWTMLFESNIHMILFWSIVGLSEGYSRASSINLRGVQYGS
tara:strand:- start:188 stop:1501 length:1314 start_codon:yes stop_codon:yes gene_type:complete